jgi:mannose-1-phosphate guanylyltransferase
MAGQIVPVIMCGGAGTRLWPVSRESMPKQFVPLLGEASTFQQVLARISEPDLFARPIVITNTDFRLVVAEQLREHGIEADIVLEPMRRELTTMAAHIASSATATRACWRLAFVPHRKPGSQTCAATTHVVRSDPWPATV